MYVFKIPANEKFRDVLTASLSFVSALALSFVLNLEFPIVASLVTMLLAIGTLGESISAGLLRIGAATLGSFLGLGLITLFPQYIWYYLASAAVIVAIFTYLAYINKRYSPFFFFTTFMVFLIWDRAQSVDKVFEFALGQIEGALLGMAVYLFFFLLLSKKNNAQNIASRLNTLHALQKKSFHAIYKQSNDSLELFKAFRNQRT